MNEERKLWENSSEKDEFMVNSVWRLTQPGSGMEALRKLFPDAEPNEMNFVLFSTSGVHGSYITIEQYEAETDLITRAQGITFVIVQPRILLMRYGSAVPTEPEDFDFLKKLRRLSWDAVAKIGFNR